MNSIINGLIQDPDVDIHFTVPDEIFRMKIDSAVDMQTTKSIQETVPICDMMQNKDRILMCEIVEKAS